MTREPRGKALTEPSSSSASDVDLIASDRESTDASSSPVSLSAPRQDEVAGEEASPPAAAAMRRWVLLAVFVYTVVFSVYSVLRYYDFRTLYFDLGIHTYSMERILHGQEGIETLIFPSTPGHVGHLSPILAPVLALYALVPVPETLLVLQSALLGIAALPLYDLALKVLGRPDRAGAFAFVYLLYPAIHGANRYDFHIEVFIPLFGFVLLLALVRKQYRLFLVASLLVLSTHEFVSILFLWSGALLLLYHWRTRREMFDDLVPKRYSETVFLLGAVFLVLAEISNRVLTPSHGSIFDWLGVSAIGSGGPGTPLFSGLLTADPLRVVYWLLLLAPLLFLPLWEWRLALPVVPWIGITALSSNPAFYSIYFQYAAFVIPPLFFAAIWALRRPARFRFLRPDRRAVVLLVGTTVVLSSVTSVLSPTNFFDGILVPPNNPPYPPAVTVHDQATARLLGLIPPQAAVLAQNELFTQVSDRRVASIFWNDSASSSPPDYIAVDLARVWYWDVVPPSTRSLSSVVPGLLSNFSYGLAGFSATTFVYGLNVTGVPDYTVPQAAMPRSPAEVQQNWSAVSGALSFASGTLRLDPIPQEEGLAWTSLPHALDSLYLSATLRPGPVSNPPDWSGLFLGTSGSADWRAITWSPSTGQVHFVRMAGVTRTDTWIGNRTLPAGDVTMKVLLSGGSLQVWLGGRLAGELHGLSPFTVKSVGIATAGESLNLTAFSAYRSVADEIIPRGDVPWAGILAFLVVVIPTFVLLAFWTPIRKGIRRLVGVLRRDADPRGR